MKQTVTIQNALSALEDFHREITGFCGRQGISSEVSEEMFLVGEELLTNTISYGYEDEHPHQIEIEIEFDRGEFRMRFVDDARPYNPLKASEPDLDAPIEERAIGGLGVHLVKVLTDRATYTRLDQRNCLCVKRKIDR
jgi:serine/threonine-protein kinase RsbW